jgi:uncharacterized protein (DUF305 family)
MKTYIQNMSKKNLAIASLIVGFLIGVLVVGLATLDSRDGRQHMKKMYKGNMEGKMKIEGHMMQSGSEGKMNTMSHEKGMEEGDMSMEVMMKGMMAGLEGKTGLAFDQAFLSEMIIHHQGAVNMAKQVLATSKRPELIKLANEIIAAQTKEIEMMKKWQTEWVKCDIRLSS